MKKGRPGYLLTVLCRAVDKERVAGLIFTHTSTIGIKITEHDRYVMKRDIVNDDTPAGEVRRKISEGFGTVKEKYEFEDWELKGKLKIKLAIKSLLMKSDD